MKLEVRVPISPRPYFFKQVEFLLRSMVDCGGLTANVRFVVSVGDDIDPYDIAATQPWSRDRVQWRWVDRAAFRRESYGATGMDRFQVESDADIVLLADADILFVSGVDDLLQALALTPAVAGVMAHVPPFYARPDMSWPKMLTELGMSAPKDMYQHTGWGRMSTNPAHRFGPAYFNYGAVFVPGKMMPRLADSLLAQARKAVSAGVGEYRGQLALTLALYELDLPRIVLEPRFNFPNDKNFEQLYPADLRDVRIIHYLRLGVVDRQGIWETPQALDHFLARTDLDGTNEILRRRIKHLVAGSAVNSVSDSRS
jgi:hypothetical protein